MNFGRKHSIFSKGENYTGIRFEADTAKQGGDRGGTVKAVAREGRASTLAKAYMIEDWVNGAEAKEKETERQRQQQVACAMLKSTGAI